MTPGARLVPAARSWRAGPGHLRLPPSCGPAAAARPRRRLVLGICCTSIFLAGLDNTAVTVALPAIGRDLHAPVPGLQWTIDAYLLALASMMMLAGVNADRFGRRRIFRAGLALFAAGSLACSLAPGLGWLIGFRAAQGIGGSMLNPAAMSLIAVTFTGPAERARAISVWHAVFGLSMAAGPVLGGLLVAAAGWRAIFWLNIPAAVAASVLAGRFIPESRAGHARRPDPGGQLLVTVMLGSLTYAIIQGPGAGWSSARITGSFALAAAAAAALAAWEPRRRDPVIDLRLFRSLQFSGSVAAAVAAFAALGGFLFLSTLYLQDVRGLAAAAAGLRLAPMAAAVAVCAPLAGRLVAAGRTRIAMLIAGTALTLSCAALPGITAARPGAYLLAAYALFGCGIGMVNEPVTYAAVSGLPPSRAGQAGGINSSSRMVGQVLGVAVAGPVLAAGLHGPLRAGFLPASHLAWWVLAGTGFTVLLAGILATGPRAQAAAPAAVPGPGPGPAQPAAASRIRAAAARVAMRPAGRHARRRGHLAWPPTLPPGEQARAAAPQPGSGAR